MQAAIPSGITTFPDERSQPVQAVSSHDLQRALEAARALRGDLTRLAEYLRLLAAPESPDLDVMTDMLQLAAASLTKVHPVIEPRTHARVALVGARLPSGYVLQSDFAAASRVRAKLLPACLVMQQRLVNQLGLRFPGEDVALPRYG